MRILLAFVLLLSSLFAREGIVTRYFMEPLELFISGSPTCRNNEENRSLFNDYIIAPMMRQKKPPSAQYESIYESLDSVHATTTSFIQEKNKELDEYALGLISDANGTKEKIDISNSKQSYFEFAIKPIFEGNQDTKFQAKVTTFVVLPKTFKKMKVYAENFYETESIDQGNANTINHALEDNAYLLGFEKDKIVKNIKLSAGAGLKGGLTNTDFYLRTIARYEANLNRCWDLYSQLEFKYFLKNGFDNILDINFGRTLSRRYRFGFNNRLRYIDENNHIERIHSVGISEIINHKMSIDYVASIFYIGDNLLRYAHAYDYLHMHFRHLFHKEYLYYEFNPGVIWRVDTGFKPSYRVMLSFGLLFGDKGYMRTQHFSFPDIEKKKPLFE